MNDITIKFKVFGLKIFLKMDCLLLIPLFTFTTSKLPITLKSKTMENSISFQIKRIIPHTGYGFWVKFQNAGGEETYTFLHPRPNAHEFTPPSVQFPSTADGSKPDNPFVITFQLGQPSQPPAAGSGVLTTYHFWQKTGDTTKLYTQRNSEPSKEFVVNSGDSEGKPTLQLTMHWNGPLGTKNIQGGFILGTVDMDPDPEFTIHSIAADISGFAASAFPLEVSPEDNSTVLLYPNNPFTVETRALPKLISLEQMKGAGFFPVQMDVSLADHAYTYTRFSCFLLLEKGSETNNANLTFYWYKDGDTKSLNKAGRFVYEDLQYGSMRAIFGYQKENGIVIEKVAPYVVKEA
jgi:hypothetical protein